MKRQKLLLVVLFVIMALCMSLFLASCSFFGGSGSGNKNGDGNNNGGGASDDSDSEAHTHTMTYYAPVAPTCSKSGRAEYWQCNGCRLCFSDEEGKNQVILFALNISATGHKYSHYVCTDCNDVLSPTSGLKYELNAAKDGYIVTDFTYWPTSPFTTTLIIPETYNDLPVKEIGEGAFRYSSGGNIHAGANSPLITLNTVWLPDQLEKIGENAFSGCEALRTVNFGNSVKWIGSSAFSNCSALSSVEIPDSVLSIDDYAFINDNALKKIVIGSGVNYIGIGAFQAYAFSSTELETVIFKETTGWQTRYNGNNSKWVNSKLDLSKNENAIRFLRTTNNDSYLGRGNNI